MKSPKPKAPRKPKPSAPRPAPSTPGGLQTWVMQGPIFFHGYSAKEVDPHLPKDGVARCRIASVEADMNIPFATPADLYRLVNAHFKANGLCGADAVAEYYLTAEDEVESWTSLFGIGRDKGAWMGRMGGAYLMR